MSSLVLAVLTAAATAWSWRREPRRLRNGVLLLVTGWFALPALQRLLAAVVPGFEDAEGPLLLAVPFSVVVLAAFLVADGVAVSRREGLGAATALPVLAGAGLVAVPVAAVAPVVIDRPVAIGAAAPVLLVPGYVGVAFSVFVVCAPAHRRVGAHVHPDAVVVLATVSELPGPA